MVPLPRWLGPGVTESLSRCETDAAARKPRSAYSYVPGFCLRPLHALRSPSSSARLETSQSSGATFGGLLYLPGLVRPGCLSSLHEHDPDFGGAGPPIWVALLTSHDSTRTHYSWRPNSCVQYCGSTIGGRITRTRYAACNRSVAE